MSLNQLMRVLYQDGLLLTGDLCNLEQNYQRNLAYNQNMALFTPGIISGFQLTGAVNANIITVNPGVALDAQGRLLILSNQISLPVPTTSTSTPIYISIQYNEIYPDQVQGVSNLVIEQPLVQIMLTQPTAPALELGSASATNGVISEAVSPMNNPITSIIPFSPNIPSVQMYPFTVTIQPSSAIASGTTTSFTDLSLPPALTGSPQLLISVQEFGSSSTQGLFLASVYNIDTSSSTFCANIQFIASSASSNNTWSDAVYLNCIAWENQS